jgi:DTW domain-containing protein YfiP
MCEYITKIDTKTKFVLLMHPKEYRKTKNGTGHFTNKSLTNSEIHIGIDFSDNRRINQIIENKTNSCYILYPDKNSIKLNEEPISTDKNIVLFIIDSTWACSKKMLRVSRNLKNLKRVSFKSNKESNFRIKEQPNSYCLSTIESTQYILELLNYHKVENIEEKKLALFTKPFDKMVEYQLSCIKESEGSRHK